MYRHPKNYDSCTDSVCHRGFWPSVSSKRLAHLKLTITAAGDKIELKVFIA